MVRIPLVRIIYNDLVVVCENEGLPNGRETIVRQRFATGSDMALQNY